MTNSFWNGKKVLVTGAGGFIGSQLTETLAQSGAAVRAFVRYNSRRDPGLLRLADERVLREMEIIFGDIRDADAVTQAVRGCDLVFHLGALISIPYSYVHPREVAEVNWMGTLNVLTASRECGVGRVLHTSTSEVYGTALRVPIDEDHPLQGQSPYSASKIGADKMAESFYCAFQLPVVTVRPFNTYGPRQSARAVIPTIITQALALDEIHLGNLDTRRDFTFVSDTVRGFLCAAQAEQVEGETFNLGTGQEVTIRELLERILKIVGRDVRVRVDDQRLRPENSEVLRLLSNNEKARQRLHWQPEVSLEAGLEQTVEWIRQHQSLYRPGVYEF
ncbi:GDP-mannose 4,6-dehydratase [Levilinea saccharolytica]|uniref:NAD-dependent dehydratase n=1 Tax=Levilinea saccharolytica TaxID=229921 RepID=A0A0P6YJM9_9CHLR|nr:GDP-mannose 4,6-dehydratase [Levilinea saccharolytica]KPL90798.1 NAD-dependent dehydratase [Levilinea saccharolytica]GAP17083.1 nucleoside-diphosphate-sugar epimerase [Levilinea saccharolytica]